MTIQPLQAKRFRKHDEYVEAAPDWKVCRDSIAGERVLKQESDEYLPVLPGLEGGEKAAYIRRASYFNGPSQTVAGLVGTVLRKPPIITYPDAEIETLDALGVEDEPLTALLRDTLFEVISVGRVGFLVDTSRPTEEIPEPRPYVAEYKAEAIWNWKVERVRDRLVTTAWVLHETHDTSADALHGAADSEDQWRVLRLGHEPPINDLVSLAAAADGDASAIEQLQTGIRRELRGRESDMETRFYWQEVWRLARGADGKRPNGDKIVLHDVIIPRKSLGAVWQDIPFTVVNQSSDRPQVQTPPLLALAQVAVSHFRNSADMEWGLFWTAIPTPYVTGLQDGDDPTIGAARLLTFSEADTKVGYAEFSGAGLTQIREQMRSKSEQMAVLGSRLMDGNQKAGVEAAEAIRLRLQGDSATLGAITLTAAMAWTQVLKWVWDWRHQMVEPRGGISVELNTDFNSAKLEAPLMGQLMAAFGSGYIDFSTWFYNLQKHELVPPGMTEEDMIRNILEGQVGVAVGDELAARLMAQLGESGVGIRTLATESVIDEDEDEDEDEGQEAAQ